MVDRIEFRDRTPRVDVRVTQGPAGPPGETADLGPIQDAIDAEVVRATAAEGTKADGAATATALAGKASTGSVSTVATDLATEVTRATTAEGTKADASATTTALAGKASTGSVTQVASDLTAEIGRATTAEGLKADGAATTSALAGKASTASVATVAADLVTETSRATTAEGLKATTTALTTETNDRIAADLLAVKKASTIEITWNAGDATSKLAADEYFSQGVSDTATSGFTRTIVETNPPGGGSATVSTARLRVSCPAGLVGASTRAGLPIIGSTSVDDEIESVWLSHTVGAQLGHFHRKGVHPSTGNPMAYVAWMDALFLVDSFFNLNTWENNVAGNALIQGSANDNGAADLTALQHWVDVLASSKTGTTVTLTVPRDHGIVVGDSLNVVCTSILDNPVTVTALPDARTITYTSATTAATPVPVGGAGQVMSRNTVYPLKVKTRLEGTTLRFKAWPYERMGEPDFSTVNNALTFINTGTNQAVTGRSGIVVAHLNNDTYSVDIGSIKWRNLDA